MSDTLRPRGLLRVVGRVGRQALTAAPVIVAVSMLTFGLMNRIPGDQTTAILGTGASAETRAALREQLGLDRPLIERYLDWAGSAVRGDLGQSYRTSRPVAQSISERLPVTIELLVLSQLLALVVAVPVGVWSAHRRGRRFDNVATAGAFGVISVPSFVLGLLLVFLFSHRLRWFPSSGYVALTADPWQNIRHLVLPVLALAAGTAAIYTRILRAEVVATLDQEFIAVARAKGLSTRRILFRHALRPSLLTLITVIGLTIGSMMGGALVVEVIFGLPGIGTLLYNAILNREYVLVQGVVIVIAVSYVVLNLLVDLSYSLLDPRVRRG